MDQAKDQHGNQQEDKKDKKKKVHVKKIDLPIDAETLGLSKLQLDSFYEFEVSKKID